MPPPIKQAREYFNKNSRTVVPEAEKREMLLSPQCGNSYCHHSWPVLVLNLRQAFPEEIMFTVLSSLIEIVLYP